MDVAFVVDESVTCEKLMQCMASAGGKLLEDARLFDVYRDERRIGAHKKSMAFALTYRAGRPHAHRRGGRQGARTSGEESVRRHRRRGPRLGFRSQ